MLKGGAKMVKITLGDRVFEVEKDTRIIDFMNSFGIVIQRLY